MGQLTIILTPWGPMLVPQFANETDHGSAQHVTKNYALNVGLWPSFGVLQTKVLNGNVGGHVLGDSAWGTLTNPGPAGRVPGATVGTDSVASRAARAIADIQAASPNPGRPLFIQYLNMIYDFHTPDSAYAPLPEPSFARSWNNPAKYLASADLNTFLHDPLSQDWFLELLGVLKVGLMVGCQGFMADNAGYTGVNDSGQEVNADGTRTGSALTGAVAAGATSVPVADTSVFTPGRCDVDVPAQTGPTRAAFDFTFTGRSTSSGPGNLTGIPASGAGAIASAIDSGVVLNPTNVNPINPATGAVFTKNEWMHLTRWLILRVREQAAADGYGNPLAFVNGPNSGRRWFDTTSPTSILAPAGDVLFLESYMREGNGGATTWRPETAGANSYSWASDLNAILDIEATYGKAAYLTCKAWSVAAPGAAGSELNWERYALASYLLVQASDGRHHLGFSKDDDRRTGSDHDHGEVLRADWDLLAAALGKPLEAATGGDVASLRDTSQGAGHEVYIRDFERGKVLVNPDTSSKTYQVDANYQAPAAKFHPTGSTSVIASGSSITVPAHEGVVLHAV